MENWTLRRFARAGEFRDCGNVVSVVGICAVSGRFAEQQIFRSFFVQTYFPMLTVAGCPFFTTFGFLFLSCWQTSHIVAGPIQYQKMFDEVGRCAEKCLEAAAQYGEVCCNVLLVWALLEIIRCALISTWLQSFQMVFVGWLCWRLSGGFELLNFGLSCAFIYYSSLYICFSPRFVKWMQTLYENIPHVVECASSIFRSAENSFLLHSTSRRNFCQSLSNSSRMDFCLARMIHRKILSHVFILALVQPQVIIITNSDDGWVKFSAERFVPNLLPVIERYRIVSARTRYERFYPNSPLCWKAAAFAHEANEIYENDTNASVESMVGSDVSSDSSLASSTVDSRKREIISFGDSMEERTAVRIVSGQLSAVPKSVMFISSPSPLQLIGQLNMVTSHMKFVCEHESSLDLEISPRQAQRCAEKYMGKISLTVPVSMGDVVGWRAGRYVRIHNFGGAVGYLVAEIFGGWLLSALLSIGRTMAFCLPRWSCFEALMAARDVVIACSCCLYSLLLGSTTVGHVYFYLLSTRSRSFELARKLHCALPAFVTVSDRTTYFTDYSEYKYCIVSIILVTSRELTIADLCQLYGSFWLVGGSEFGLRILWCRWDWQGSGTFSHTNQVRSFLAWTKPSVHPTTTSY